MATRRQTKPATRKICILGYAEETRELVFQLPEDVEIWGINMAHAFTYSGDSTGSLTSRTKAKATNWFQLHPRDWKNPKGEMTGFFGRPKEHLAFLAQFPGDVWLQVEDSDIPNGKRYPLEKISEAARLYFTSTFAYQLGMAWYQHRRLNQPISDLYIYGVNLSSMDEYIHQKSCVEYWLGRLEEAGVRLHIPDASALLKGKVYAMGTGGDIADHAFERLQHYKGKYMESWANVNTGMSMKAETQFWAGKLSEAAEKFPEQFNDEVKAFIQESISKRVEVLNALTERSGAELNGTLGMVKENQHWLALTGGIDHRAPALPELRLPSVQMSTDFDLPKLTSI